MIHRRVVLLVPLMSSCANEPPKIAEKPKVAPAPKPKDEERRFPKKDLVRVTLVDKNLLGKDFMPGGNLGEYKGYKLFLAKTFTPDSAAILLLDFKNTLKDPKFVPSFGGYYGTDTGTPMFIFTKNAYLLGVVGLVEKDADPVARAFAGRVS